MRQLAYGCTVGISEKGVIHLATAAVGNALWDMYARTRQKPLWKLIADMTPVSYYSAHTYPCLSPVIQRVLIHRYDLWLLRRSSSDRPLSGKMCMYSVISQA